MEGYRDIRSFTGCIDLEEFAWLNTANRMAVGRPSGLGVGLRGSYLYRFAPAGSRGCVVTVGYWPGSQQQECHNGEDPLEYFLVHPGTSCVSIRRIWPGRPTPTQWQACQSQYGLKDQVIDRPAIG